MREYNTDLQNKVDINNALKNGDIGKQLKYWEDIHSVSKEKYAEAMEKGEGEKALQYKDMMIKASGYVQTLLEGRKEQLENFTNYEAVSNMAGIGGTLGWNFGDSLQEELNKTAKQSLTQLEEINRKLDKLQEANIIQ